jgi:hypothetical protein
MPTQDFSRIHPSPSITSRVVFEGAPQFLRVLLDPLWLRVAQAVILVLGVDDLAAQVGQHSLIAGASVVCDDVFLSMVSLGGVFLSAMGQFFDVFVPPDPLTHPAAQLPPVGFGAVDLCASRETITHHLAVVIGGYG